MEILSIIRYVKLEAVNLIVIDEIKNGNACLL